MINGDMTDFKSDLRKSLQNVADIGMNHLLEQTKLQTINREAIAVILIANGLGTVVSFYLSKIFRTIERFEVIKYFGESCFTHTCINVSVNNSK